MNTKAQEPLLAKAVELSKGATVLARSGDQIFGEREGQLFSPCLEILLVRDAHIIVREKGKKDAKKFELPRAWGVDGHKNEAICPFPLQLYSVVDVAPMIATEKAKKAGPKRKEGPTKMDKCREIYKANPTLDKKTMVQKFIDEAGCTAGGANTYYVTLKKGA